VENSFKELIDYIGKQTSFRCQHYKEKPLKRRIKVRMRALNIHGFEEYHQYLKKEPEEMERLLDTITINLSYFFRNPETFEYLSNSIFPEFKKRTGPMVFWSAGCAHGEEPYSLAITAAENSLLHRVDIYGTDIDNNVLQKARAGVYTKLVFQYTAEEILKKYFTETEDGFAISDKIKRRVTFLNIDLFEPPSFDPCDLIVCRNVLIYLDRGAQSTILKNFYDHLKPGGYLVIGKAELLIGIPEVKLFEVISRPEHVYRKKPVQS